MKHTIGPWITEERNTGRPGRHATYTGYQVVARVHTPSGKGGFQRVAIITDTPNAEANADLVAAAHELLEALSDLLAEAFASIDEDGDLTCITRAEEAIRKARGGR